MAILEFLKRLFFGSNEQEESNAQKKRLHQSTNRVVLLKQNRRKLRKERERLQWEIENLQERIKEKKKRIKEIDQLLNER